MAVAVAVAEAEVEVVASGPMASAQSRTETAYVAMPIILSAMLPMLPMLDMFYICHVIKGPWMKDSVGEIADGKNAWTM